MAEIAITAGSAIAVLPLAEEHESRLAFQPGDDFFARGLSYDNGCDALRLNPRRQSAGYWRRKGRFAAAGTVLL
jgi:hypothetical protein